jgi:hypothetical protein
MSNLNPSHPSIEGMDRLTTAAKQLRGRTLRHIAARINSDLKLTKSIHPVRAAVSQRMGRDRRVQAA